jgi:excisionase family DNA binding protein
MIDTRRNDCSPSSAHAGGAKAPPAPAGVQALLWDLAECAVALGVSTRTVKRMAAASELPGVVRLGRCRRFDRRRIEQWISEGCPPVATGRRPRSR